MIRSSASRRKTTQPQQSEAAAFTSSDCSQQARAKLLRPVALLSILLFANICYSQSPAGGADEVPPQFGQYCAVCHGGGAEGTDRAPPLLNSRQLRGQSDDEIGTLIKNGSGNMPAFSFLPLSDLQRLAHYVHSLNANAFDVKPAGNVAAGAAIFFGRGGCAECHTAQGQGKANGPDLSNVARALTVAEIVASLNKPGSQTVDGYELVSAKLKDGSSVRGYARSQGAHSLALQTVDGKLLLFDADELTAIESLRKSAMPAYMGNALEKRDLVAYLSTLSGVAIGPASEPQSPVTQDAMAAVLTPKRGEWPTYSGNVNGNRHSVLSAINTINVSQLRSAWIQTLPYSPLETTPLVVDGVMYVTGPNQVYALNARNGAEIWSFIRARSSAGSISGDAARGATRGAAILGDRLFFISDDAHLICLHKLTGAILWEVVMPEQAGRFGGTSAPLVVNDLVIAGVSGGDEDIRGFLAAYRATTGERVWRTWTIPKAGEHDADSWQGADTPRGGATWLTPSFDAESGILYVATGNPYPDTDGDNRVGDNLYTDSDLALDVKTGKLIWHFQFTPHDLHDWDANQPIVLVDAKYRGAQRKLLLHANRNGFFYVLDRTNGRYLSGTPLVKKLNWAGGIAADGRPLVLPNTDPTPGGVETCPAVRGATNWYSTAYNPSTNLYYVMTVEDCTLYRKAHDGGYGHVNHPDDPPKKVLRAIDIESGKFAWELPLLGNPERNYSGVLSTDGGLVFYGETSGGIAAADAATGAQLWHYDANQILKGSPMTYEVKGRQYVAIAAGANILAFSLSGR